MLIGFRKVKLFTQLLLLVSFPILLTIAALSLHAFYKITTLSVATFMVFGVSYMVLSVLYIRKLIHGLGGIKEDVVNLSEGKFLQNGKAGVAEEITLVSTGLNKVLSDIKQKSSLVS
jgi:signal transduction histidine kinase